MRITKAQIRCAFAYASLKFCHLQKNINIQNDELVHDVNMPVYFTAILVVGSMYRFDIDLI